MKIRLYRGPFNGKVMEHKDAGRNEIHIREYKRMSRKEKWEAERRWFEEGVRTYPTDMWHQPIITATYRLVVGTIELSNNNPNFYVTRGICMHPDGSIFYEWVNPKNERVRKS